MNLCKSVFLSFCGLLLTLSNIGLANQGTPAQSTSVYQWSGLYLGGNLGAVKHTMNVTDNQATSFNATIQETSNPQLTGGLQLGYRRSLELTNITGVYGLEFSTNFSQANFNETYGSPYALYEIDANNELKNTYLLQLIGGIAVNRMLLFLAGGFSWVNLSNGMTETIGAPYFVSFNSSNQPFGTAFSAGVEYAFFKTCSARFKLDAITPNTYFVSDSLDDHFQVSNFIVTGSFGINYQFDLVPFSFGYNK